MTFSKLVTSLLAAAALCGAVHASTVFNFDGDNLGTSTTFTDKVNGVSATFSSPADPGGFVVYSSMFQTLTGNVLGTPGPSGMDNLALTVQFSQSLSAVTLNFATSDFSTPSPVTLTALENSNLVGTASSTGSFLNGYSFPEGEISFAGGVFNQLMISSTATDFAVDNLNVVAAPEPAVSALFALGLLAFGIPATLRKRITRS